MTTFDGFPSPSYGGAYTTIGNIKSLMPDTTWSTSYDRLFSVLSVRASRLIDGVLHREPGALGVSVETTRYFDGNNDDELYIGELASVPSIVSIATGGIVDNANDTGGTYTVLSASDYRVWPSNWSKERRPILRLDLDCLNGSYSSFYGYPKCVKVIGYFGFATILNIPDEIVQAVDIQTIRWFKRGQQAFQDVGAITDLSQLKYVNKLDPDVENIINLPRFTCL